MSVGAWPDASWQLLVVRQSCFSARMCINKSDRFQWLALVKAQGLLDAQRINQWSRGQELRTGCCNEHLLLEFYNFNAVSLTNIALDANDPMQHADQALCVKCVRKIVTSQ